MQLYQFLACSESLGLGLVTSEVSLADDPYSMMGFTYENPHELDFRVCHAS